MRESRRRTGDIVTRGREEERPSHPTVSKPGQPCQGCGAPERAAGSQARSADSGQALPRHPERVEDDETEEVGPEQQASAHVHQVRGGHDEAAGAGTQEREGERQLDAKGSRADASRAAPRVEIALRRRPCHPAHASARYPVAAARGKGAGGWGATVTVAWGGPFGKARLPSVAGLGRFSPAPRPASMALG